ncbi:MAG: nitroreductase [Burkholderiaceae bacterium]
MTTPPPTAPSSSHTTDLPGSAPDADAGALALALIRQRFSVSPKRLVAPGPAAEQLAAMVEAAGCAPDHELLRPWRLIHIVPGDRVALAEVFVRALLERLPQASPEAQAQAREKAFRAPELLLAIARLEPAHANVPEAERYVSLGAAMMNLLLAAHGLGFGAMLTSGHALQTPCFAEAFGLAAGERAVCFVSIGTPTEVRRRARPSAQELVSLWQPQGAAAN